MTLSTARSELTDIFLGYRRMMVDNDVTHWLRGVDSILSHLTSEADNESAMSAAYSTYKAIVGGPGKLEEFYVVREDSYTMNSINIKIKYLRNRSSKIFNAYRFNELGELEPAPSADENP